MVFEHIEKLQAEYLDKYVVVDDQRPELQRFNGLIGIVKTVNMSGRALVQFDGRKNFGWYDIDLDYLKVVEQPLPQEEPPPAPRATPAKKAQAQEALPAPEDGGTAVEQVAAASHEEPAAPKTAEVAPPSGEKSGVDVDLATPKMPRKNG